MTADGPDPSPGITEPRDDARAAAAGPLRQPCPQSVGGPVPDSAVSARGVPVASGAESDGFRFAAVDDVLNTLDLWIVH